MKLGMHASAWCRQWDHESLFAIDEVKALGLDFIEIPLMKLDGVDVNQTRRKLKEAELEAVTSTLITNPAHDLTSSDSCIRAAGVEYLKQCILCTSEIGATFFSGVIYALHMKSHPARPSGEVLRLVAEQLREVAQYAAGFGITVGIEPINRYETFLVNTCEQAEALIELIGEPNVKIHLDTYHMNIEEKSIRGSIRRAGRGLGHIHLNENDWGVPGTGHMEWNEIFQTLSDIGYDGYASLECVVDFHGGGVYRQLAPDSRTLVEEGMHFFKAMKQKYSL